MSAAACRPRTPRCSGAAATPPASRASRPAREVVDFRNSPGQRWGHRPARRPDLSRRPRVPASGRPCRPLPADLAASAPHVPGDSLTALLRSHLPGRMVAASGRQLDSPPTVRVVHDGGHGQVPSGISAAGHRVAEQLLAVRHRVVEPLRELGPVPKVLFGSVCGVCVYGTPSSA